MGRITKPSASASTRLRPWAAAVAALLLASGAAIFAARLEAAAFLAKRYIAQFGIDSDIRVFELSGSGIKARLRLGDSENPDFAAEQVEIALRYDAPFWFPHVQSVSFVGAHLSVRYDGRSFSFGALEPFIGGGGGQDGLLPDFTVENSSLALATPFGAVTVALDARAAEGKLQRLNAVLTRQNIVSGAFNAAIREGTLTAETAGELLNLTYALDAESVAAGETDARGVKASGALRGAQWTIENGAVRFRLQRAELAVAASQLNEPFVDVAELAFRLNTGVVQGTFANGAVTLLTSLTGELTSEETLSGIARVSSSSSKFAMTPATISTQGGRYTLSGPARIETVLRQMTAHDVVAETVTANAGFESATAGYSGTWSLEGPVHADIGGQGLHYGIGRGVMEGTSRATIDGSLHFADGRPSFALDASVSGDGSARANAAAAIAGRIALVRDDPVLRSAFASAIRTLALRAPQIAIVQTGDETTVSLNTPLSLTGAGGAKLALSQTDTSPIVHIKDGGIDGGMALALTGGRLARVELALPSYRIAGGTVTAMAMIQSRFDYAGFRGIRITGAGDISGTESQFALRLARCAVLHLDTYQPEAVRLASALDGHICAQPGEPFLSVTGDSWRISARWSVTQGAIDSAEANVSAAEGSATLSGSAKGLASAAFAAASGVLTDRLTPPRFNAIGIAARGTVRARDLSAQLTMSSKRRAFADVTIRHSLATGNGAATIDAPALAFAPGQLQPEDISPLLGAALTRVQGTARFNGAIAWENGKLTSGGHLAAPRMAFNSPAGAVRDAAADIEFSSLLPVAAGPGQSFTAAQIDSFLPAEKLSAKFSFTDAAIRLEEASATIGGGTVRADPMTAAFAPEATTQGTLHLSGIDATPLLAAAGLQNRVTASARISGIVPFSNGPEGLRFANGRISSDAPGRIAIKRETLTGAATVGAAGAAPPNAIQDFAYQAMENLDFKSLDATVDSLANGRLGILFHIVGKHAPAEAAETRVPIKDLINGTAFNQPIPLPKGTPVDLRLDTTINLDELLNVYWGRGSATASPQSPVGMRP